MTRKTTISNGPDPAGPPPRHGNFNENANVPRDRR
jgi:hypothetical protein